MPRVRRVERLAPVLHLRSARRGQAAQHEGVRRRRVLRRLLRLRLISADDFNLFRVAPNVDAAIEEVAGFYKNFRSYRWVGPRLVIRIEHRITTAALAEILEAEGFQVSSATVPADRSNPSNRQDWSNRSVGRWEAYLSSRISTHIDTPNRPLGINLGTTGAVTVRGPGQEQFR